MTINGQATKHRLLYSAEKKLQNGNEKRK